MSTVHVPPRCSILNRSAAIHPKDLVTILDKPLRGQTTSGSAGPGAVMPRRCSSNTRRQASP